MGRFISVVIVCQVFIDYAEDILFVLCVDKLAPSFRKCTLAIMEKKKKEKRSKW